MRNRLSQLLVGGAMILALVFALLVWIDEL